MMLNHCNSSSLLRHLYAITKQVMRQPSQRSEAQALGRCCIRSIFLQILFIFLSPEGFRLQFAIPSAYFVYTVWHCTGPTGQHCSFIYECTRGIHGNGLL